MNASMLLHEEDVGVPNALSHIKLFVSFICSGIKSVTFVFVLYFSLCILQQQVKQPCSCKDIYVVQLCTLLAENIASLLT
jgi:hypothetical protein